MKKFFSLLLVFALTVSLMGVLPSYTDRGNAAIDLFSEDIEGNGLIPLENAGAVPVSGDADGDGELTDWDAILFERYLANWKIDIVTDGLDLDSDGEISDWDAIILNRFLCGWNGIVLPDGSVSGKEPVETVVHKKYFTMSFDDGITQDARIIEILKKYNMPCTFNINTGLYGVQWDWVAEAVGKPGLLHKRFTKAEIQSGIYDGFDVEVHTLSHPSLAGQYEGNVSAIKRQVGNDANNIKQLTGVEPCGMAYPGGLESDTSDFVIRTILENTPVRFARLAVNRVNNFALPEYWMMWYPTCSISNISYTKTLFKKFLNADATDHDLLFYAWGHGYELDQYDCWDKFEELIKMISEAEDVVFVTNAEFYEIFKDQIPSWKEN
ncbi:MAG: polysaccharide deacetylase family protein [Clostridia bacterium]|nr:polysaccharide deacetylase family protein [Clostridia bacterium]